MSDNNVTNTIAKEEKIIWITGKIVLKKKKNLEFNDFYAFVLPNPSSDEIEQGISLHLISADKGDAAHGGKVGKPGHLGESNENNVSTGDVFEFKVTFDWEDRIGVPGAFIIKNHHHSEFYLKTLTLEDVPHHNGPIHFVCNSWVYPAKLYKKDRVFFTNKTCLPSATPIPLLKYRKEELQELRGNGEGYLQEWDRVYDYAYYNDLGNPNNGPGYARPVLGGSEYPYPRRGRTGRPPTQADPESETRLPIIMSLNIYVPRDERFSHLKMSDFLKYALTSGTQLIEPVLQALSDSTPNEFDSFEDVQKLYKQEIELQNSSLLDSIGKIIPPEMLAKVIQTINSNQLFKYPMPRVIAEDKTAWRTDEEFAREMLAGVNPVVIRRLQKFPPESNLDPELYVNQTSSITEEHIKDKLDGLTIDEAINKSKLFILDHHDALMPYLSRINNTTSTKTYATRTLLFLKDDGTLRPLAIELSKPCPDGDHFGAISKVYTPAEHGIEGSLWQLAKAYVAVNDSGYHQLISHWLNTHAVIEPFVIATHRQLSVLHPIYKLLHPHFRDTMNINAFSRQILINAGGVLEYTVYPAKYSMEMSSMIYKKWVFTEQALPEDLKKRGIAIENPESLGGLILLIKDYPYAVDGLEIWSAIETWVDKYCSFYYKNDNKMVQEDSELQSWWKELREVGHGDLKDEPWWPKMQTCKELKETCTIIIWLASALHAAVNFGQYAYAGYLPNRPTLSRRFMPKEGTPEYAELESDPDKVYLKTITALLQTLVGISLIEILSRHTSDEVYLGQSDTPELTSDAPILKAFDEFGKELGEIEKRIIERNNDRTLKNRVGPVQIPYTSLYRSSEPGGLTPKGIPNSISI